MAECTAVTMRRFDHLGVYVSPLYRQPTLTDEEREAIKESIQFAFPASHPTATTLRNLLQRTK
jgi:hypothetical protein